MAAPKPELGYSDLTSEETLQATRINADQQSKKSSDAAPEDAEKVETPPSNPGIDPASFPDGGAKAWLAVAGASACLFVSFGWVNCVGVFQEYYQTNQLKEYSTSEVAWIPALQSTSFLS